MYQRFLGAIALSLVLVFSSFIKGSAAPVTRSEAQQTALEFMARKGMPSGSADLSYRAPRRTSESQEQAYYYVFNADDGHGFVVVSGDDRTEQVLGYSTSGTFDEETLPAHVRSFLQFYADEIQYIDDAHLEIARRAPRNDAAEEDDYPEVLPLLTSQWDQSSPYSDLCPNGFPTGCAATSTAQVMYYHKWPAATQAEIPAYRTMTRNLQVKAVPEGSVLNWDAMLDSYQGNASTESRRAVAELMSYVGASIMMDYDFMGSGAMSSDIGPALNEYFDYQVTYLLRDNFTLAAFEDSVYQQLAAGLPVIYNGHSSGGGHSFVVDGYGGDHYFHVNWGWGGTSDNYFLLSVLNPYNNSSIGASSSSDGFSYGQDVLFVKPRMQTRVESNSGQIVLQGVTDRGVIAEFYNITYSTRSFEIGLGELVADSIEPLASSVITETLPAWNGDDYELQVPVLSEGTHRLVPIYRQQGETEWIGTDYPYADVIFAADGTFEFNTVWNKMDVTCEFTGNLITGYQQPLTITFRNTTDQEFYGPIYFYANHGTSKSPTGRAAASEGFTIPAGDSLRVTSFSFRPSSAGDWTVSFASDYYGRSLLGSCTVRILSNNLNIDGLHYKLNASKREATLVAGSEDYAGHIVIPDSIAVGSDFFGVTAIDRNAFNGCTELLSLELPATLTSIGEYCFEGCVGLTALSIPAGVKSIGPGVFAGCINLTDITVDAENEKYSAHEGMLFSNGGKTLTTYPSAHGVVGNLPDSLKVIGDGSMSGTAVTRLILPESITTLGSVCFSGCDELETVVVKSQRVPSCLTSSRSGSFVGLDFDKVRLVVPVGMESLYADAGGWNNFSQMSLFKVFGKRGIDGFSSSLDVNLDEMVVVDDRFETTNGVASAHIVAYDEATATLYAPLRRGIVEAGTGLLVEGEQTLLFPVAHETAGPVVDENLLKAALTDTDLSTVASAYVYRDGAFHANATDVIEAGGAYLVLEGAEAATLPLVMDEMPGAIEAVSIDSASAADVIDLQGRKAKADGQPGFYIVGGTKILRR